MVVREDQEGTELFWTHQAAGPELSGVLAPCPMAVHSVRALGSILNPLWSVAQIEARTRP